LLFVGGTALLALTNPPTYNYDPNLGVLIRSGVGENLSKVRKIYKNTLMEFRAIYWFGLA
jgi:hypothetical protein